MARSVAVMIGASRGALTGTAAFTGSGVLAATSGSSASTAYVTGPADTGFYNSPSYPGGTSDKAGASLTNGAGITVQSNTTYSNYRNLGQGEIGLPSAPVHNVTFNNCVWETSGTNAANVMIRSDGPMTFNYCTVRPTGASNNTAAVAQTSGYQYGIVADGTPASPGTYNTYQSGTGTLGFYYCDVWGYANATKTAQSTASSPIVFDHCWVHNSRLNTDGNDHTDGIGNPAGGPAAYVTINACRIEDDGDTNGICYQNTPGPSTWDHFTITNNLISGWGFAVNISGGTQASPNGGTNIIFTDNTFSTAIKPLFGPLYDNRMANGTGSLWRRNKWLVPAGAAWGSATHDGWFWMPVASNIVGTDDTPFVSLTDYTG